ncbi:hypothetical protein CHS0354_031285 [Potamilus streckersoni]|uniref:Uncharacterized protein n=1 Tax=Potamilus streckersoni TaxID=2493646 RepID=A0AAE0WAU2_9BIVA|nr:hypothetical protein CHS0354_031285 [Potamilus streckersoni]
MTESSSTPGYCKIYFKESKTSGAFGLNLMANSLISPTHSIVLTSYLQSTFAYSTAWSSKFLSTSCCKDSQAVENRATLATMSFTDAMPEFVTASHPTNVEDSGFETITTPSQIFLLKQSIESTKLTSNSPLSTVAWMSSNAISDKHLTSEGNTFLDDRATSAITGADTGSTYITSSLEARNFNSFDIYSSEIIGSMAHSISIQESITKTQDIKPWINVINTDTFYSQLSATEANWDSFAGQNVLKIPLAEDSISTISDSSTDAETYPTDDVMIKYACADKQCLYIQPVG